MKQVLVPIALVRVFQQCSRESEHVPEHPPCEAITNVRFVPKADIMRPSKITLLDHLVSGDAQCLWHRDAECLGRFEIDKSMKL